MTNREAHEEAAGMGLEDMFFRFNKIDPDAEAVDQMLEEAKGFTVTGWTLENHGIVWTIPELMARFATKQIERQTPAIIDAFVEEVEKEVARLHANAVELQKPREFASFTKMAMQTVKERFK